MLGHYYKAGMGKYATFNGRATLPEYWYLILATVLGLIACMAVDHLVGTDLFAPIWIIAHFLPTLSAQVRRLHDSGRSGWWSLLALVPLGVIVLIVFLCKESDAPQGDPLAGRENTSNPHTPGKPDIEGLERLHKLKQSGAINEQEFNAMKGKLL